MAFVTNNSVRSHKDYVDKFKTAEVDFNPEELVHPLNSIIDYLNITNFEGRIYCIANQFFKNSLKEAGFDVIEDVSYKRTFFKYKWYSLQSYFPDSLCDLR